MALALEKCLLVTSEVLPPGAVALPPPPLLSCLARVNENPPGPIYPSSSSQSGGPGGHVAGRHVLGLSGHDGAVAVGRAPRGEEDGTTFTGSLLDVRMSGGSSVNASPMLRRMEEESLEDHWPDERNTPPRAGHSGGGLVLTDRRTLLHSGNSPHVVLPPSVPHAPLSPSASHVSELAGGAGHGEGPS